MFTMLLNHIADIFLQTGTWLCEIFIAVGYFTAISMIYFLVEGYHYTHSEKEYFLRLLIFGFLSEIPYCLALTTDGIISFCGLNMMLTLSLCFGLVWIIDNLKSTTVYLGAKFSKTEKYCFCNFNIIIWTYELFRRHRTFHNERKYPVCVVKYGWNGISRILYSLFI